MKQLFFIVCCCIAAMSATAQPLPINHPDSAKFLKEAAAVVQNAPFIFKGKIINQKAVRGEKDEVIAVGQLRIIEVVKGNIAVGDTVEFSYSQGFAYWQPNGTYHFPNHGYQPDMYWGDTNIPSYYFAKPVASKSYFPKNKAVFALFSEYPFSLGSFRALEEVNPDIEYIIRFNNRLNFRREANFLNYLNKLLTPHPIERIQEIKKRKKGKHRKSVGGLIETNRYRLLPQNTIMVSMSQDSSANLAAYNGLHNGWYKTTLNIGNPTTDAFLRSIEIDVTYDNFYFYSNAVLDTSKIKISDTT